MVVPGCHPLAQVPHFEEFAVRCKGNPVDSLDKVVDRLPEFDGAVGRMRSAGNVRTTRPWSRLARQPSRELLRVARWAMACRPPKSFKMLSLRPRNNR
jgi:hypothetical protein